MKRLIMMALAIGGLAAATGCGKKSTDLVGKAKGIADKGCACKGDEKCLDGVKKDWEAFMDAAHKGAKPSDDVKAKVGEQENRLEACAEGGAE